VLGCDAYSSPAVVPKGSLAPRGRVATGAGGRCPSESLAFLPHGDLLSMLSFFKQKPPADIELHVTVMQGRIPLHSPPANPLLSARCVRREAPHTSPLFPSGETRNFSRLAHICCGVRRRYAAARSNRHEKRGVNYCQAINHYILFSYIKKAVFITAHTDRNEALRLENAFSHAARMHARVTRVFQLFLVIGHKQGVRHPPNPSFRALQLRRQASCRR